MEPDKGRRVITSLFFNSVNVSESLQGYLTGVTFTDVASGSSDSISINLADRDLEWIGPWYPTKGDTITGGANFLDWNEAGDNLHLSYGTFIMDSIKFTGGPARCTFGGLSIPQDQSFKTRPRTQTWENVMLSSLGAEIAGRYGLGFSFRAPDLLIESIEQTDKTDSDFLYSVAKDYGLKMKVYNKRIVMFDAGILEAAAPVCTIDRNDFIDDDWDYDDELEGTYTGATIKYKPDKKDEDIQLTIGRTEGRRSRALYINQKCDSLAEAERKARGQINEANEAMTKLSGAVWMRQILHSGQTVKIAGFGHGDGKYFIDKVTTSISDGATKQSLEMHKCYGRF